MDVTDVTDVTDVMDVTDVTDVRKKEEGRENFLFEVTNKENS